jgi:hypothetical protein
MRWAIGFLFRSYFSSSKASPNDSEIVIVIIIVIGEAVEVQHGDGIIAQRLHFGSAISSSKIPLPAGGRRPEGRGNTGENIKIIVETTICSPKW